MSFSDALYYAGMAIEAALVVLLSYRCVWRSYPFFFAYCIWDVCMNVGMFAIRKVSPVHYTFDLYIIATVIDSVLQFIVLIEIAWSVLRPLRAYLSLKTLAVLTLALLAIGAIVWPLAAITNASLSNPDVANLLQLQHTVSILRILFFLLLASCSQFLSLGWRDRELQIASGFGIFAMVSLAVAAIQPAGAPADFYQALNTVMIVSYICCLIYWFVSFIHQEAERQAFNPQMRELLLSVAGAARTTRMALESSLDLQSSRRRDP
jgi:hypothetical protein